MSTLFSTTKDSQIFAGRNAIINGNFLIWARGSTFNPVGIADYTSDRWRVGEVTDGSMRVDREETIKPFDSVSRTMKVTVLTGDSSLSADQYSYIFQRIEGYNYLQFIGKQATLSFWVRSSVTGTYSVAFRNASPYDRSYVAEYTIDNANTWEYKTITVAFNYTGGTWNTTNGTGLDVLFSLGLGSTYAAAPGSWISSNKIGSTNQVNWMATAGNTFYLSNVQLELGGASPFERIDAGIQVMQCARYYEARYYYSQSVQSTTGQGYNYNMVPYFYKRTNPTVTNAGDLTIWARVAWYNATSVSVSAYPDRMYFLFRDTVNTHNYGAALVRGTFYIDAEL